ncbi:MAG TPA: formylmethanofuran dehydrogenase subunit C [Gemmatimonadales bacterium]|nr:formylmethanofuran dehydrogenase subunit C [Gemmatimonadales bacterium]
MSGAITLTLRGALDGPLELPGLAAAEPAALGERELARLEAWHGGRRTVLGEFFEVTGGRAERLVVRGDLRLVEGLGAGLAGGELIVEGDAGPLVGARMTGGRIEVRGDAGHGVGLGMAGGTIVVRGNAGDRVGSAVAGGSRGMTGGEIVIHGDAGAECGALMRRGVVAVRGTVGPYAGRTMIAGTVLALGRFGPHPGRWSKRGSLVALGGIEPPATYRYACTYRPPHLAVLLRRLRGRYGLPILDEHLTGRYHRHCGDMAELGKGEILAWMAP